MDQHTRIVLDCKQRWNIRIRRWRDTMTGAAWQTTYDDGRVVNWIEAPKPTDALSLAIFLHEVGHHAIGLHTHKRRCEEEHAAWTWTLSAMRSYGVEPDQQVMNRIHRSMRHVLHNAKRKGLREVPQHLSGYLNL